MFLRCLICKKKFHRVVIRFGTRWWDELGHDINEHIETTGHNAPNFIKGGKR